MTHFQIGISWNYPVSRWIKVGWCNLWVTPFVVPLHRSWDLWQTCPELGNLQNLQNFFKKKRPNLKNNILQCLTPQGTKTFLSTVSFLKREDPLAWKKPKPCTKRCTRPICSRSSRLEIYDSERRDSLRLWEIYMLMLIKNKERHMKWYHIWSYIDVIRCEE